MIVWSPLFHSIDTFKTHSDQAWGMNQVSLERDIILRCLIFTNIHLCMLFQALEDAFLAIDNRITTEEVIKELVQIAGRPTEEPPAEKVAEEDDCEFTNTNIYLVMLDASCKEHNQERLP